jgi:hypothetical protein
VVHNQAHQVTGAAVADIEAVYRSRLDAFVRVCTALLGDREQAIDAVHDGFAAALTRRTSFRGDGTIEGWLWAVVVNARPKPPPCRRSPPGRRGARCSCGRGCRPAHSRGGRRPPGWLLLAAALVIPTGLAVAGAGQGVVHYLPGPTTPAERATGRLL